MIDILCNLASYFFGTTFEGGCMLVTLFIFSVIVSIIGMFLKKYEIENYDIIIISFTVIFLIMSLSLIDLMTVILSIFILIAVFVLYINR